VSQVGKHEEEEELPLACQTAIVKRRQVVNDSGVIRYGDWAKVSDVDAALSELCSTEVRLQR
jgi:hypothetical protein